MSIKGFYETVSDIVATKATVRMKALEAVKSRNIEWPEHVDDYSRLISALVDSAKQGATGTVTSSSGSVLVSSLGCLLTVLTEFQNSVSAVLSRDRRKELISQITPISQKIIQTLIFILTDQLSVQKVLNDPGAIEYVAKIIRLISSHETGGLLTLSPSLFTSSIASYLVISLMRLPSSSCSKRRDDLARSAAISVLDNFGGNFSKSDSRNLIELSENLFSQSSKIPEMLFNINLVTKVICHAPLIFREIFFEENCEKIQKIFQFIFQFLIPGHQLEKPAINLLRLFLLIGRNIAADWLIEIAPQYFQQVIEIYKDSTDETVADLVANFSILKNENSESNASNEIFDHLEKLENVSPIFHFAFASLLPHSFDSRWRTDPFFVEQFLSRSVSVSPKSFLSVVEKSRDTANNSRGMIAMWTKNIPELIAQLTAEKVTINADLIDSVIALKNVAKLLQIDQFDIPKEWFIRVTNSLSSFELATPISKPILELFPEFDFAISETQLLFLCGSLSSSQIATLAVRQVACDDPPGIVSDILHHFTTRLLAPVFPIESELESLITNLKYSLWLHPLPSRPIVSSSSVSGTKIRLVVKSALKFCATSALNFSSSHAKPNQQIIDAIANLTLAYLLLGNVFSSIRCDPCIVTSLLSICSQGIVSRSITELKIFISKELAIVGDLITLCSCPKHVDKLGEPRSLLSQQPVTIDAASIDIFDDANSSRVSSGSLGNNRSRTTSDLLDPKICVTRAGWVAAVRGKIQTLETGKWDAKKLVVLSGEIAEMKWELDDQIVSIFELISSNPELQANYIYLSKFFQIISQYFLQNREKISESFLQECLGARLIGDTEETGGFISLTISPILLPFVIANFEGVYEEISSSLFPPTIGSIQLLLTTSLQTNSVDMFTKTIRMTIAVSPHSITHFVSIVRESFSSVFDLRKFLANFFILFTDDEELLDFFAAEIGFGLCDILDCVRTLANRSVCDSCSLGAVTARILTDFSPLKPVVPENVSLLDIALLGTEIIPLWSSQLRDPFQALQPLGLKLADRPWLGKYLACRKKNSFTTPIFVPRNDESAKRPKTSALASPLSFVPSSSRTQISLSQIAENFFLASFISSVEEIDDTIVPTIYGFLSENIAPHMLTEIIAHLTDGRSVAIDSTKTLNGSFPRISYIPSSDTLAYPVDPLCEMVHSIAQLVFPDKFFMDSNGISAWIFSNISNAQLILPFLILRSSGNIAQIINFFLEKKIRSITVAITDALCSICRRIEFVFTGFTCPDPRSKISETLLSINLALLGTNLLEIYHPEDAFFVAELIARLHGDFTDSSQITLTSLLGNPPVYLALLLQSLNLIGTTKISSLSSSLHPSLRSILSRLRGDAVSLLHEDNESDRSWACEFLGLTFSKKETATKIESLATWNTQQFFDSSANGGSQVSVTSSDEATKLKCELRSLRTRPDGPSPQSLFEYEETLSAPFPPSATDTIDECWVLYVSILRRREYFHRARKISEEIISNRFSATTLPATALRMYMNLSKIYWRLGMLPEATKLIMAICSSSESPASRLDDAQVVRIVPRLLSQTGEWLGQQRLEPLSEIRKKYFARAIQIMPESDLRLMAKIKIRLVKVIDPELIETKSPPKSLVQEEVGLLCEILTCGILPVMKAAWFSSRLLSLWFAFPGIASLTLAKHRSILAASEYMLPFFYQIAGQIGSLTGDENIPNEFKKELVAFIVESGRNHPFICLPPLLQLKSSSTGPTGSPAGKTCSVQNAKLDNERAKNAEKIIEKIKNGTVRSEVESMESGFKFYLNLAMAKPMMGAQTMAGSSTRSSGSVGPKRLVSDIPGYSEYAKAIAGGNCPILTCSIQIRMKSIVPEYMIADSGKSLPKIVKVVDVEGKIHRQIVKGNDDLRNDAVLQQLFSLIDALCSSGRLRSYKVVPISACAGIAEWVDGTVTLGGYLVGYPNESSGAHCRYRPNDMTPNDIKSAMVSVRQQSKGSVDSIRSTFSDLTRKFQPCMHYFFYENFATTNEWYNAQNAFTSSVAATSIVGFIVGLGDRHPNNILIDIATGEVVHIDYGICFDAGRQLKIPEIVPFRLTRDMVDGLGCLGVQGPFAKICQDVLMSLKEHATLVTAVVEVFVVDPLFNWAVAALGSDNAQVALESVRRKLQGFLEVSDALPLAPSAQVDRLIRSATDPRNLALMFAGWQPWL